MSVSIAGSSLAGMTKDCISSERQLYDYQAFTVLAIALESFESTVWKPWGKYTMGNRYSVELQVVTHKATEQVHSVALMSVWGKYFYPNKLKNGMEIGKEDYCKNVAMFTKISKELHCERVRRPGQDDTYFSYFQNGTNHQHILRFYALTQSGGDKSLLSVDNSSLSSCTEQEKEKAFNELKQIYTTNGEYGIQKIRVELQKHDNNFPLDVASIIGGYLYGTFNEKQIEGEL